VMIPVRSLLMIASSEESMIAERSNSGGGGAGIGRAAGEAGWRDFSEEGEDMMADGWRLPAIVFCRRE
jgi:hypothetical protein